MVSFSKPDVMGMFNYVTKGRTNKAIVIAAFVIFLYLLKLRKSGRSAESILRKSGSFRKSSEAKERGKGHVDEIFFQRIKSLIRIVIPSWKSKEVQRLVQLTLFLVLRTFLSIYIAGVNGRIVNAIVNQDIKTFGQRVLSLALLAIPASFVNSYLDYLIKKLSIHFRTNLTDYFHNLYLKDMIYYQISNLDARVSNPDQKLTVDIDKWSFSLASLYSNFSKPLLDIVLFSRKLSELVGWQGPGLVFLWYGLSGAFLRLVSPPFGKLTAIEQRLEGEYRACHTDLLHHAEEIAFYRGHLWEKERVNNTFRRLVAHAQEIMTKKMVMGSFDSLLVKYGAVLTGYAVVGLPVFGPNREEYLKKVGNDSATITRDYVRNSSLLINLAKAIGRIVISYKELQHLAGYTTVVCELKDVIQDLRKGIYNRTQVKLEGNQRSVDMLSRGEMIASEQIKFEDVPIVSPTGDVLVQKLSFEIEKGMNCVISGPNGCGKSSMFRILGGLWPAYGGKIYRPNIERIFYLPQRPYLPRGTLRDLVIYPHSKMEMMMRGVYDSGVKALLEKVQCGYLIDREGGFDATKDWNDTLSGGEKQRIVMARLFYHKPNFAILDECTSNISLDAEAILYNHCKELGITLFTISHRTTLFKFHEYILKFDGEGNWSFEKLIHAPQTKA